MIRKLQASDKAAVLEITKNIWGGHDYLPKVFDRWITLAKGEFIGLFEQGKLIGVTKTTHLDVDTCWLEGFRVHEEYQGRGFGKHLAEEQLKRAVDLGYQKARLSTYYENKSIGILEKQGFNKVASFRYLEWTKDGLQAPLEEIHPLQDYAFSRPLVSLGWKYKVASRDLMKEVLAKGGVYKYKSTAFVLLPDEEGEADMMLVDYKGLAKEVVLATKALAQKHDLDTIAYGANSQGEIESLLEAGAEVFNDAHRDVFIYEKNLRR